MRIEYRVARAEATGLADASIDLVTAAQALHWFDAAGFFTEARRILVQGGVIAVWGYGDPILDAKDLNDTLYEFNRGKLESYWHPERELLLQGYRAVPFPFVEIALPPQYLEVSWTLPQLAGYLRTWSAAARYIAERGLDPVDEVEQSLSRGWGDPNTARVIRWPLYVRAGRVTEEPATKPAPAPG